MPESPFLDQMERVPRHGAQRWRRPDRERIYEWDHLHKHVEVFNKRGRHLGAVDSVTGEWIKSAEPSRRIDV